MTLESEAQGAGADIAIIARVGRFPGARNVEEFWDNLRNGIDSISRFAAPEEGPHWRRRAQFVGAHGVLDDVEYFDHAFFDYPASEAALIDPQQRIFLEQATAALEEAGYDPDTYPGLIGVYAGLSLNTYLHHNILRREPDSDSTRQFEIMVANDKDYLATRVSYKLNLKGPSYTIQTACSTSLVAVHVACQSLLSGECNMALAGGVTVRVPQTGGYLYEEGMIFARDGRVRSFDAAASGTVLGSGVGIVVLKPLDAALEDRDTIHAVIKGSATNNDGSYKASYAAPGREGQVRVILEAQSLAGVNPDSISYVEAHATGTLLGDPVEVAALTEAFRKGTAASAYCAIGSVKSNVGHLDCAAGITGLIKTVLMLEARELVPTVHFTTPNPNIAFRESPFRVSDRLAPWPTSAGPRRAAVSSLGVGGTNAHVILEEAPPLPAGSPSRRPQLIALAGKTIDALERRGRDLRDFLERRADVALADVAFTLCVGRHAFKHRRVVVSSSSSAGNWERDSILDLSGEVAGPPPPVVLVIPALTSSDRHVPHARSLLDSQPLVREHIEHCDRLLASAGLPESGLAAPPHYPDSSPHRLVPAFVSCYSLTAFWVSLGIRPQAILAQGLGELVGAVIAGAVPLQRALQLVALLESDGSSDDMSHDPHAAVRRPAIPLLACAAGAWTSAEVTLDPRYWRKALVRDVSASVPCEMIPEPPQKVLLVIGSRKDCEPLLPGEDSNASERLLTTTVDAMEPDFQVRLDRAVVTCVARLWLAGCPIDWIRYFDGEQRRRIRLPTYPFARVRHWLEPPAPAVSGPPNEVLHPLLHRNVSSFRGQRFRSAFTGHERFFTDHVVAGRKILPAVAYLEMIRAAVEIAWDVAPGGLTEITLSNVVWMTPLVAGVAGCAVSVELRHSDVEHIEYTVRSTVTAQEKDELHSQGRVELRPVHRPNPVNVAAIQARLGTECIEQTALYERFAARELTYGPAHRGLLRVYRGATEALAHLVLPSEIEAGPRKCLHPGIMDAALQVVAMLDSEGDGYSLPFELGELQMYASCNHATYAWVRTSERSDSVFDIDVCNADGAICVSLRQLATRRPGKVLAFNGPGDTPLLRYLPVWNPAPVRSSGRAGTARKPVVLIGAPAQERDRLGAHFPAARFVSLETGSSVESIAAALRSGSFAHLVWIAPEPEARSVRDEALLQDQQRGSVQLFRIIQALLSLGYADRELELTVVTCHTQQVFPAERIEPSHATVHGLAGSLAKEYEQWRIRLLDLDAKSAWPIQEMFDAGHPWSHTRAYRDGQWFIQQLVPAASLPPGDVDFRVGGVYVIIGGAGGIGEALSRHLAREYLAHTIWIGRRALDETIQSKIASFPPSVPAPQYLTADAADAAALARAAEQIRARYPRIDGVIHSAIVLADKTLANMTEQELLAALRAKVDVSVRIAQVWRPEEIDFVLFFSSIQSFTRSPGQGNYAAGCLFKDAFAHRLALDTACTVKTVNWGFWGGAGVVDNPQYRARMARAGIGSIAPGEGMGALMELMRSSVPQVTLYKGTRTDALNAVSADELYLAYPAQVPSVIHSLRR